MITRNQARVKLKKAGVSQRRAAPIIGVTFTHLNLVLNGHRDSARLLRRIEHLTIAELQERSLARAYA